MTRPLRSVLIGDVDFYPSEFAFGVAQAMARAGHYHTAVNVRQDAGVVAKRLAEMRPDVIWGHMLLWPPPPASVPDLLELCAAWRARGARVLLHDGDARAETRFPTDISPAVDLALCNHTADRSAWKVRRERWPYFAFDQDRIADPAPELACDLAFAGRLDDRPLYAERTALVLALKERLGDRMRVFPSPEVPHTLWRTPELAASARAVLGYGRPAANGWVDVRTFQYPGAGGLLLSNDVGGYLEPGVHYMPYQESSADEVLRSLEWFHGSDIEHLRHRERMRTRAFAYVQQDHSATARVRQALGWVGLTL